MLNNTEWQKHDHTPVDITPIDDVISWLEKQPANREYAYLSKHCLFGQYLRSKGVSFTYYSEIPIRMRYDIGKALPHTFGAALERAREYRDDNR